MNCSVCVKAEELSSSAFFYETKLNAAQYRTKRINLDTNFGFQTYLHEV